MKTYKVGLGKLYGETISECCGDGPWMAEWDGTTLRYAEYKWACGGSDGSVMRYEGPATNLRLEESCEGRELKWEEFEGKYSKFHPAAEYWSVDTYCSDLVADDLYALVRSAENGERTDLADLELISEDTD
jgi:hypothetical protein